MKTPLARPLLCLLFASMCTAYGATNYVTPGESIQAAVNASSPGDTIVIFGGTYTESVVVNKWLSIVRQAGQTVYVTGSFTFEGISAAPATPLVISNLKIGGDSGKRLNINNCINVTVNNLDLSLSGLSAIGSSNLVVGNVTSGPFALTSCPYVLASAITVSLFTAGSCLNVVVADSTLANANMGSSTVNFSRVTVNGVVTMNNTGFTNRALNLLQCTITNGYVDVQGMADSRNFGRSRGARRYEIRTVAI